MKTSQWCWVVENRCVFIAHLKVLSDRSSDRSAGGRRFHVAGPLTAKLCCPVTVWARGTSRVAVAADHRCWRPEMAVAGTEVAEMGWSDTMNICPDHQGRLEDYSLTGSQYRSSRTGVMCSLRRTPDTMRAAMFCTDWSFSRYCSNEDNIVIRQHAAHYVQ